MAWMPSASNSATTTMIASSSSVPPADFLRLALLATGAFAVVLWLLLLLRLGLGFPLGGGLRLLLFLGPRLLLGLGVGLGLGLDGGLARRVDAAGDCLLLVEQPGLDRLVRPQVAALAHPRPL